MLSFVSCNYSPKIRRNICKFYDFEFCLGANNAKLPKDSGQVLKVRKMRTEWWVWYVLVGYKR